MKSSLTGQLFLSVAPIVIGMLMLIGAVAFISTRHEINEVSDLQMANDAAVLWSLTADELNETHSSGEVSIEFGHGSDLKDAYSDASENIGDARMFRIWKGKRILMKSDTALPAEVPEQAAGFHNIRYEGNDWRIYSTVTNHGTMMMEVGEKQELRDDLIASILLDFIIPLLIAVPLLVAALWFGIRRGIGPVKMLVEQIQQRNPEELAPLEAKILPRDLKPLAISLNRLLSKLGQSLSAERRFADHAAHQLRTPLAGTKLLIHMLRDADSDEERLALLKDLAASNEQSANLVQKLLTAARVSYQPLHVHAVDIQRSIAEALGQLSPFIEAKQLKISQTITPNLCANADDTLLALVLHNLLDNAIKYTPIGGRIAVRGEPVANNVRILISDSGAGIPTSERDNVFQRFYRVDEAGEGTGLGLAIVAEAVARLQGNIRLETPENGIGLEVIIELPAV